MLKVLGVWEGRKQQDTGVNNRESTHAHNKTPVKSQSNSGAITNRLLCSERTRNRTLPMCFEYLHVPGSLTAAKDRKTFLDTVSSMSPISMK